MITITPVLEDMMAHIPVKVKPDKVMFSFPGQPQATIPSKLYPLHNKKTIQFFHHHTTEEITNDEAAKEAFDRVEIEKGMCYFNVEKMQQSFEAAGLGKDFKSMTGWIISPDGTPIHHAWGVYKNKHILDGAAYRVQADLVMNKPKGFENASKQEVREHYIKKLNEAESQPNHEKLAFGKALPIFMYVGTETTPEEGRKVFQRLTKQFPKHPSYAKPGMNQFGESEIQRQLREGI